MGVGVVVMVGADADGVVAVVLGVGVRAAVDGGGAAVLEPCPLMPTAMAMPAPTAITSAARARIQGRVRAIAPVAGGLAAS